MTASFFGLGVDEFPFLSPVKVTLPLARADFFFRATGISLQRERGVPYLRFFRLPLKLRESLQRKPPTHHTLHHPPPPPPPPPISHGGFLFNFHVCKRFFLAVFVWSFSAPLWFFQISSPREVFRRIYPQRVKVFSRFFPHGHRRVKPFFPFLPIFSLREPARERFFHPFHSFLFLELGLFELLCFHLRLSIFSPSPQALR